MFICKKCFFLRIKPHDIWYSIPKSLGPCEICQTSTTCADYHVPKENINLQIKGNEMEFTKEELEEIHEACTDVAYHLFTSSAFGVSKDTIEQYDQRVAILMGIIEKIWSELKEEVCIE